MAYPKEAVNLEALYLVPPTAEELCSDGGYEKLERFIWAALRFKLIEPDLADEWRLLYGDPAAKGPQGVIHLDGTITHDRWSNPELDTSTDGWYGVSWTGNDTA